MPTPTYDLIASTVLTGTANTISLTAIPNTYRDLVAILTIQGESVSGANMTINSDSGSNYNYVAMQGDGSSTAGLNGSSTSSLPVSQVRSYQPSMIIIQFLDYSATDKHKSILWRDNIPDRWVRGAAARWASTSAITSFSISANNNLGSGTSLYLYGIVS